MNNQIKNNGVKKLLNSLSLFQKISLAITGIAVVVGLILLINWSNKPEYAVLYSNLNYEEASEIVAKLKEEKIQYQISDDGDIIKVKKTDLANARLTLASEGIPNNSVVGFELFDQQFFGLTDFTQKVNYQRALEGELSRTIAEIEEVESARVHLVLSEDELFSDEVQNASASVILKLKSGKNLYDHSVIAITNLVANAVKNLNTKNISITDTNGNLLTAGNLDSQQLAEQQKATEKIEKELENKISAMLTKIVGAGNSIVSVMAEINNNQKEEESETYIPSVDGQGIALSKNSINEKYDKAVKDAKDSKEAGTGSNVLLTQEDVDENIPQYKEVTDDNSKESNFYDRSEEEIEYGVSRVVEKIKYGVGDIKKLSVGVFLNSGVPADKLDEIKSVIVASAGIDKSRGDVLSIERMDFAAIGAREAIEEKEDSAFSDKILYIVKKALPGGLLVILLLLLTLRSMGIFKKRSILSKSERKNLAEEIDKELMSLSDDKLGSNYDSLTDHDDGMDKSNASFNDKTGIPNFFASRSERLSKEEKRKMIIKIREKVLNKMDETMYPELKEIVSFESSDNPKAAAKAIRNWLAGNV
ncbi:MAG: flagellar basal-body MS-ring/collar protein FliF [Actinomycetota bacterium]|nr:flagellar basal-body MS-ring/collar protein FliF [Actinomycetota bacterium]